MKKQLTFAILLFSSLSGYAQVTQVDLEKEIKPLTQRVNTLQVENGKLKTDIGILNSKLLLERLLEKADHNAIRHR